MKYLLLFTALIITATDADLICQCSAPTSGPACTVNKCTITKGQCYLTEQQIATEQDKPVSVVNKGCQEEKDTTACKNEGVVFISTENVFYLLNSVQCCNDTNECNKDLVDVSKLNKTFPSKKLVCPSCFALGKKTCDVVQMTCRENQDKCFSINGTITKGSTPPEDFVAKGCAPSSAILKSSTTLTFGDNTYKLNNVEVVEAKSSASQISSFLSFAILLPNVLWFLLDSSLY